MLEITSVTFSATQMTSIQMLIPSGSMDIPVRSRQSLWLPPFPLSQLQVPLRAVLLGIGLFVVEDLKAAVAEGL